MLQWMGVSRQKFKISRKSTHNRQRQYFEQRKQQEKTTGYEGHADETSIAGQHQKECRSLDILSLLNVSTFSAVGKCYPSTWASLYLLLFSDLFDEGSSNDLVVNRSSIISNMILGDQTDYLLKSELAPEKLEKVKKRKSNKSKALGLSTAKPC